MAEENSGIETREFKPWRCQCGAITLAVGLEEVMVGYVDPNQPEAFHVAAPNICSKGKESQ